MEHREKIPLTFACGPYDRMGPLFDGTVTIEGVSLKPVVLQQPMDIFSRMLAREEFDVAEMSFTHCFVLRAAGTARFVTLPVFPSRMFRHGFIFVNTTSGITRPRDLAGKRIGVQGYQMTAAVWIRGLLREYFDVDLDRVSWFEGGVNEKGVPGGAATRVRPDRRLDIQSIGDETTLNELLERGELDALIGAIRPASLGRSPHVARLFPNYHEIERAYFKATGVHPIMHGLVMRKTLYETMPSLAQRIVRACEEAKLIALRQTRFTGALRFMLPWLIESLEEIDEVFGGDPWPYGIAENRPTLDAFNRYLVADGFYPRPLDLDEVFVNCETITGAGAEE